MKFAVLATALIGFAVWAATPVSYAANGRSISTINGDVEAVAGETYDALNAVNGEVRVGRGAIVGSAKTVNGEVEVETNAKVGTVSTVNGAVEIAEGVTITEAASTVNGEVKIGRGTKVGGDVSTVSGEIELKGAEVAGNVTTVNGDVDLTDGAHVRGALEVKRPHGNWKRNDDQPVKVSICATCAVDGELRFERPVELHVEPGAKIGKVIGESVTRR